MCKCNHIHCHNHRFIKKTACLTLERALNKRSQCNISLHDKQAACSTSTAASTTDFFGYGEDTETESDFRAYK